LCVQCGAAGGGAAEGRQEARAQTPLISSDCRVEAPMALPVPDDNRVYGRREYWDARFAKEESYDWLGTYADVRPLLRAALRPTDRILLIGCGNSTLSADLYDDGFTQLTNIDYSAVVIDTMRAKHAEARPAMKWECMNMLALAFDDGAFDVVLDKAAMDALCVDEGDVWNPAENVRRDVHTLCRGIHRCAD
jgi:SAM-dependent methyltransferase